MWLGQSHCDNLLFFKFAMLDDIYLIMEMKSIIFSLGIMQGMYTREMDLGGHFRTLPIQGIIIFSLQDCHGNYDKAYWALSMVPITQQAFSVLEVASLHGFMSLRCTYHWNPLLQTAFAGPSSWNPPSSHVRAQLSTYQPLTHSAMFLWHGCPGSTSGLNTHLKNTWGGFCWNAKTAIPAALIWNQHNTQCEDYVDRSVSPPDAFRSTMWVLKLSVLITHYNPVL